MASWLNVQHLIEQTRGVGYQVLFNLTYIQFTGALFRLCAWAALPESTIPPWSLKYWRDVSVVTLIGTFFGVLGYNGINCLHRKGVLSDNVRAYVQHGRDVFMLVNGVYFSAGRMTMYWCVFAVQQGLDAGLYVVGRNVRPRAGSIAEREESIEGEEEEAGDRSVVREALQAAVSPFVAVGGVVKRVFVGIVGGGKEEVDRDEECDRVMSSSTETLV